MFFFKMIKFINIFSLKKETKIGLIKDYPPDIPPLQSYPALNHGKSTPLESISTLMAHKLTPMDPGYIS